MIYRKQAPLTALTCLALATLVASRVAAGEPERIDLAGDWQVKLDPDESYDPAKAAAADASFRPVRLPGTLRDSGLGDPVGPATKWIGTVRSEVWNRPEFARYREVDNFKVPFWLQPQRHYVGAAWYRRTVRIPESWRGRRVLIALERPHWRTSVWVNGQPVGECDSLSVPHEFDATTRLTPGSHTLVVRVDNSLRGLDLGLNSHSVSDHTQSAWHGIVGRLELRAEPFVAIENIQMYPAEDARSARATVRLVNVSGQPRRDTITLRVAQGQRVLGILSREIEIAAGKSHVELAVSFDRAAKRWDEFAPNLCELEAKLASHDDGAAKRLTFGVRHLRTDGTRFVLNDRPIFLRGTLECCIFPLTGYPPTDVEPWKRIIQVCRDHGLNHIRFHSWCPPEAAFVAADELGFYYQVECSTWPNDSTSLGRGQPIDAWLYREGRRILEAYGNHPSFLLLASGNEPAGAAQGGEFLGPWVEQFKALDSRRLVTSGSGWPSLSQNQYHVTPAPRIQAWGAGLRSRINAHPPETTTDYRQFVSRHNVPVISHEIGQWCVYPDFDEIVKYRGALQAKNFEVFRDFLARAGMLHQARDFLLASGTLQALCYKEEIEAALRTPAFGGFQLLDLHDFPGQGTALVGVLDPFWNSKPYMTSSRFRRFCGPTVPLARMAKRAWTSDEQFVADVEVSHFGPNALHAATPRWSLMHDGKIVASNALTPCDVPTGALTQLGRVEARLADFTEARQLTFSVTLEAGEELFENDWDIWVYPPQIDTKPSDGICIARELTETAVERLERGGRVLLLVDPRRVSGDVQLGFSSIFWNTAWTQGQPPHTLGLLCVPAHSALAGFPTARFTNWQWWELVSRAKPMELDRLPPDLHTIVQVVPDWFKPQRLGLLFEAKVGGGKLLVCSIDLHGELDRRPVARQLLHGLQRYAASDDFRPSVEIELDALRALFVAPSPLERLGATIESTSFQRDYEAANAIDGDPRTLWHSRWEPDAPTGPHELVIDLKQSVKVNGVAYLPRQDGNSNGTIGRYAVYASADGQRWGDPVARGDWPNDSQHKTVRFLQPLVARYVKLVALAETRGQPYASAAEIEVLLER